MSRNWLATRIWLVPIILVASLSGAPAFAQGAATVHVDPSTSSVQVNSSATLAIKVDNIANLTAFELHLSFDPAVLEVTGMTNGGFVAADFTVQNTFDNAAGTIDYAIAQLNRAPAQGSGTLLTIAIRGKGNGSSTVTTRPTQAVPDGFLLSDQNGMAIQASWVPGTINVGAPPPITDTPTNTSTSTPTPITNTPTITSTAAPITNTPTNTPTLAPGAATVRVDPSTSPVGVNNTIKVCIKVDNVANLAAFEIHLKFAPTVLAVEPNGITNGGFVPADIVAQNTFDNVAGTIDYSVSQRNRSPVNGNGTLLCILFRGKANGTSTVATRATQAAPAGLILADSNGMTIPASWAPGTINVEPTDGTLGTHVVRWGEWLYCIGRAYGVSPWAIAKTNHIWWPYIIFPTQKLVIPDVRWTNIPAGPVCKAQFTVPVPTPIPTTPIPATATSTPVTATVTPAPATTMPPSSCRAVYVVRPGDTLYRIALRYGTSYAEIARVNQISNPRLIYPGQQLCIP